ncbi:MAG: hypothetical protein KBF37_03745 [Saprospiraceae bacterium]|jgi:hypothetical protein|nr:hypothetical protein [Saprospiraceae bacterium]MBP9209416.1 hypothetical protein [Saprospiraceae bacterium]MBV6471858.1 hypothetical protein [Saprospiraceae bacterium]
MKLKMFLLVALFATCFQLKAQDYKTAVGLRAFWGYALTGKHFLNQDAAVEAILLYRNYGAGVYDYSYFSLTGLYQKHSDIKSVEGLRWYWGFGANLGSWGGDWDYYDNDNDGSFFLGVCGNIGLDYKFKDIPLNLSADWIPTFRFIGWGNGFTEESGGLAIRYTF